MFVLFVLKVYGLDLEHWRDVPTLLSLVKWDYTYDNGNFSMEFGYNPSLNSSDEYHMKVDVVNRVGVFVSTSGVRGVLYYSDSVNSVWIGSVMPVLKEALLSILEEKSYKVEWIFEFDDNRTFGGQVYVESFGHGSGEICVGNFGKCDEYLKVRDVIWNKYKNLVYLLYYDVFRSLFM